MESERTDPRHLRALQGKASLAHRLSHVRDVREASRSGRLTRIGLPMARVAVDLPGGDEGAPVVADAIAAVLAGDTDGRAANSTPPSMAQARADVIVVDGFTGNVALKSMEGALRWSVDAMGTAYGSIEPAREVLPSTQLLSGASLFGVDGNIVVGHGASRADEIHGCIRRAAMLHEGSIVESVHASVAGLPELNARGELA